MFMFEFLEIYTSSEKYSGCLPEMKKSVRYMTHDFPTYTIILPSYLAV